MRGCWKSFKGCSLCYSFSCPQKRCEKYLCSHSLWQLVEKGNYHVPHSRSQMHISGSYDMGQVWLWSQPCFPSAKRHSCSRQHLCWGTAWWRAATPLLSSKQLEISSGKSGQAHKLLLVNLCWLFQLPSGPLSAWQTSCWVLQLFLYYLSLHQLLTFFLPQILPSFFKVAHICRITFVFLYDPWGEVLAQINQFSNFATKQTSNACLYLAF